MKKTILFIAASFLLFAASCGDKKPSGKKTADELFDKFAKSPAINAGEDNYVLSIPKGWNMIDTVINKIKFHFIVAPPKDAENGVVVSILNESAMGRSFDEYMEATETNMKNYMPGYKQYEKGTFMASGIKSTWTHYSAKTKDAEMECITYLIPKDGIIYIMSGRTARGKMCQYQGTFEKLAQSIKFKD
jgi:hypothetical protein